MNPLISIIVPVYKVEDYLPQCVDSILNQSFRNFELILVDDGSPDNCPKICDDYEIQDSRVKVIHKKNGGLSSARETGIKLIKGEYGMFVDSDDWLELDTLERCVEILQNNPCDCIIFPYVREYNGKALPVHIYNGSIYANEEKSVSKLYSRFWGLYENELNHPEQADSIVTCWGKLYKKELLLRGRFFDTKQVGSSEDLLFNLYALSACKSFYYLDVPLYHYRKERVGAVTNTYKPEFQMQWKLLFEELIKAKKELQPIGPIEQALDNRIALSIVGIGLNEIRNPKKGERIGKIKKYLKSELYSGACKNLQIKYLPFTWKCFLFCAQHKLAVAVYVFLCGINYLKSKK